jgi:hypothetical protein
MLLELGEVIDVLDVMAVLLEFMDSLTLGVLTDEDIVRAATTTLADPVLSP